MIIGNVCQAGLQQNPARQAAIFGGVPPGVSAMTVNKVCGSGLKAVALAAQAIRAGDATCVLAGGFENMSRIPYAMMNARDGLRLGDGKIVDLLVHDGLWDVYNNYHMGLTAEWVVDTYGVTREDQDAFAVESHRSAVAAWEAGAFAREVVPASTCPSARATPSSSRATRARAPTPPPAGLAKLQPAFKRDGGTVTRRQRLDHQRRRRRPAGLQRGRSRAKHGLKVRAEIEAARHRRRRAATRS